MHFTCTVTHSTRAHIQLSPRLPPLAQLHTPPLAVYYFSENFMLLSCYQALVMLVQNRYQRRRMYTRIALGKNSAMDVVSGESSGSRGQLLLLYPLLFGGLGLGGRAPGCSRVDALWRGSPQLRPIPRGGPTPPPSRRSRPRLDPNPSSTPPQPPPAAPPHAVMQAWQFAVGFLVALRTWPALLATEGWLDMERCQSDLRGMRGTFLCGLIYSYMAVMNFINTVATITDKASHDGRGSSKKGRRSNKGQSSASGGPGGASDSGGAAAGGSAGGKKAA
jgi:hypothetical protein